MRRVRLPNGKAVHSSAPRTSRSSDRVVTSVFTAVKNRTFRSFAMAAKGSEIAQGPVGLKVFCIRTGGSKDCIVGDTTQDRSHLQDLSVITGSRHSSLREASLKV